MTGEDGREQARSGWVLAALGQDAGEGVDGFPSLGVGAGGVVRAVVGLICSSSWFPLHNLRKENSWTHTSATVRWWPDTISHPCGEHAALLVGDH